MPLCVSYPHSKGALIRVPLLVKCSPQSQAPGGGFPPTLGGYTLNHSTPDRRMGLIEPGNSDRGDSDMHQGGNATGPNRCVFSLTHMENLATVLSHPVLSHPPLPHYLL
jgi:hypothetical protein